MTFVRRRVLPALIFIIASAALLAGSFFLCQWNNDFPVDFHPDEATKGEQLLTDSRNFHHPLLMLNLADCVARSEGTPRDIDSLVQIGRDCSALLAASGALLIAWAGFVTEGWIGFALLGLAASTCPAVISHAHYFKEEAALIFGVGAVVFAASLLCRSRHAAALLGSAVLLGIGCATAASGKYPGALFILPSIILIIAQCGRRWIVSPIAVLLMLAVATAAWMGINQRAVQSWDDFKDGFTGEQEHVTTGHFGLSMDQPNGYFMDVVWAEAMPHVAVLLIAAPVIILLQRRKAIDAARFGMWLLLAAAVYLAGLSYSVIPFFRYVLPVTLLLHVIAGLAVTLLARLAIGRPMLRGMIVGLGAGVIGVAQIERCIDYDNQFAQDSRYTLRQWVIDNVPAGARVAVDEYTELHTGQDGVTAHIVHHGMFAADAGEPASLLQQGYTYVITAGSDCDRFFIPQAHGEEGNEGHHTFAQRQHFYDTLKRQYAVAWQTRAINPMRTFANPDITVYRLFPMHSSRR